MQSNSGLLTEKERKELEFHLTTFDAAVGLARYHLENAIEKIKGIGR